MSVIAWCPRCKDRTPHAAEAKGLGRRAVVDAGRQGGVVGGTQARRLIEVTHPPERRLKCSECGADEPTVPVTCWCEAQVLAVPARTVKRGETLSCGRPQCEP